jgi:Tfp pilus assembly protein PilF
MNQRLPNAFSAEQARRIDRALRLLQNGAPREALSIARSVATNAADSAEVQHLLALCHKATGARDEAEMAFRRALELAPAHPVILGNYANLLKQLGRIDEALRLYRGAVEADPAFVQGWINLGLAALAAAQTGEAVRALERATALAPSSASAWHALGNARRAQGDLDGAAAAFRAAVARAPDNGAAWVNLSVVVKLQGRPAEALPLLDEARKAGFTGPELDDAEVGALIDLGEIGAALEKVRRLAQTAPHYTAAHVTLAHLLWEHGDLLAPGEDPLAAFREAAESQPGNGALQLAFIRFLLEAHRAGEALERVRRLRAANAAPALAIVEANALEELGQPEASGPLYARIYEVMGVREAAFLNAYTRHLLRTGQWGAATAIATAATEADPTNQEAWGHLGTAWRLVGDPREHWLCDYERTIVLVEVEPPGTFASGTEFLAALATSLDALHKACREPVNQSLRGGSQTPGRLFGRPDPLIRDTQAAITRAVERHIATLPDDQEHPFFGRRKRSVSFFGSWSVKLWSQGRHVNHFHPQGWMSSAYYVSLPPSIGQGDNDHAGWIQFGQPPEDLGLDLAPRRIIKPKTGFVALFPSYMWHGTVPFEGQKPRVTIAFDMTPVD